MVCKEAATFCGTGQWIGNDVPSYS